jgi:hypothetical protein
MIFTIYIVISLACILTVFTQVLLSWLGVIPRVDVFKMLNDLHDKLQSIEDEKVREVIMNLVDAIVTNPIYAIVFILTISFLPLFNIFVLKVYIEDLVGKLTT